MRVFFYILAAFVLTACANTEEPECPDELSYRPYDFSSYLPFLSDTFIYQSIELNHRDTIRFRVVEKSILAAKYNYCGDLEDQLYTALLSLDGNVSIEFDFRTVSRKLTFSIQHPNGKNKGELLNVNNKVAQNNIIRFHLDSGLTNYKGGKLKLKLLK